MAYPYSQKTTITGFTAAQEAQILTVLQTAYDKSPTAKAMFDTWINAAPGNTIDIKFVAGKFDASIDVTSSGNVGTGRVQIDFARLNNLTYINTTGKAVPDTLTTGLLHELVHALTGTTDNVTSSDYKGDTVKFANLIYKELGLPEQVSYLASDDKGLHKLNYEYTNGAAIDAAKTENGLFIGTTPLGKSRDLLIGGPSPNTLLSGDGDDFLFGAGGNDTLSGGAGTDTGVYFGQETDYDIQKNSDGTWSVSHARGAKDAGSDTLKNVEVVQFDGGKTYELKQAGLTFQTDFALVIDTTGSMGSSIGRVKAQASSLIDAVFAGGKNDGRIGVVGYKDTAIGQPSTVILPFTDQDDFADRKSAAIAAINSITLKYSPA